MMYSGIAANKQFSFGNVIDFTSPRRVGEWKPEVDGWLKSTSWVACCYAEDR